MSRNDNESWKDISRLTDKQVEDYSKQVYMLVRGWCQQPNEALDILLSTYLSTLFTTCTLPFTDKEKDELSVSIVELVSNFINKKVAETN